MNESEKFKNIENKEKRGAKIKGYICLVSAVAVIILTVTAVILGYVPYFNFTDGDGEIRDGFGRVLGEVPAALSLILPQWAGHVWLIIDCLLLLGMIIIADRLFVKSKIYFNGIKNVDF